MIFHLVLALFQRRQCQSCIVCYQANLVVAHYGLAVKDRYLPQSNRWPAEEMDDRLPVQRQLQKDASVCQEFEEQTMKALT